MLINPNPLLDIIHTGIKLRLHYNKPNHNTTIYYAYRRTKTTINPVIIRPHFMLTDTTMTNPNHPHIVFTDGRQPNHNTTTSCVYWRTTTTINPIVTRPCIMFTDGRQKRQTQSWFDHISYLLTDDNYCYSVFFPEDKFH